MSDDAGMREVFRGDLSSVELAAGLLEEQGIAFQRRWEQAGGTAFHIGDTALVPGRSAVLFVPTVAYAEAKEALASFDEPEPEYMTELSSELAENREKRRFVSRIVLFIVLGPMILGMVALLAAFLASFFT